MPQSPENLYNDREPEHARRAYPEMVQAMDAEIGRVVRALQVLGLHRNTLVLFLSDNGPTGPGSQGDLRGRKGSAWEGGHRVPAIAWWPGKIEARETHALAMSMDVMPTLLDLAGVSVPTGHELLDGISLRRLLLEKEPPPERTVFWEWPGHESAAVRHGRWKLVVEAPGIERPALFDLLVGPEEAIDVSNEHPAVVQRLQAAFDTWHAEVTADATPQPTGTMKRPSWMTNE